MRNGKSLEKLLFGRNSKGILLVYVADATVWKAMVEFIADSPVVPHGQVRMISLKKRNFSLILGLETL